MSIEAMPDESLVRYYENLREQAYADRGFRHQLTAGPSIREYEQSLRAEILRRRLDLPLIVWR